jgi:hypothetical protein
MNSLNLVLLVSVDTLHMFEEPYPVGCTSIMDVLSSNVSEFERITGPIPVTC